MARGIAFMLAVAALLLPTVIGCSSSSSPKPGDPEEVGGRSGKGSGTTEDPPTQVSATPPPFRELFARPFLSDEEKAEMKAGTTWELKKQPEAVDVSSLTFTPDAGLLVAGGKASLTYLIPGVPGGADSSETWYLVSVKLWELPAGRALPGWKIPGIPGERGNTDITGIAVTPDGRRLWMTACSSVLGCEVWDLATRKSLATISQTYSPILHPNGKWFVCARTANEYGFAGAVDIATGKEVEKFKTYPASLEDYSRPDGIRIGGGFDISPDGRWLAYTNTSIPDAGVRIVSTVPRKKRIELAPSDDPLGLPVRLLFTSNGKRVVALSHPKYGALETDRPDCLRAWQAADGKLLWTVKVPAPTRDIAISRDGHWVAAGCGDKVIRFLRADTGAEALVLKGHGGSVTAVAFSKDGNLLASADATTVRVWQAAE